MVGIGQHSHSAGCHPGKSGQLFAFPLLREATGSMHWNPAHFGNQILEALNEITAVDRRRGVRHQNQPRHPSMDRRFATTGQRFLVLKSRLTGVHVEIKHSRHNDTTVTVDRGGAIHRFDRLGDLVNDTFIIHEDVCLLQLRRFFARNSSVFEKTHIGQSLSVSGLSQWSTAIRTAMPFSTCVLIRLFS